MTIPRRTLDELLTLASLEPSLLNIVVEGDFDKTLIDEYIDALGLTNCAAYPVDTIEVSDSRLEALGLTRGNRQEVIAVADAARLVPEGRRLIAIIDADLDRWLETPPSYPGVVLTDWVSMEMCTLSAAAIKRFVRLHLRGHFTVKSLLAGFSAAAQTCFLVRVAHASLKLPLSWISPLKSCTVRGSAISFDLDDFLNRLLQSNKNMRRRREIEALISSAREHLSGDIRQEANFHDVIELLGHLLIRKKLDWAKDHDHLSRTLMSCVDFMNLGEEPLFAMLKMRAEEVANDGAGQPANAADKPQRGAERRPAALLASGACS